MKTIIKGFNRPYVRLLRNQSPSHKISFVSVQFSKLGSKALLANAHQKSQSSSSVATALPMT